MLAVGVLRVLFNVFQNGECASLSAAVPDHVPVDQRATVAGWFSMPQALGLLIGGGLVAFVVTGQAGGYLLLGVALALLTLPFVLLTRDHPLSPEYVEPLSARAVLRAFWISRGSTPTSAGPG